MFCIVKKNGCTAQGMHHDFWRVRMRREKEREKRRGRVRRETSWWNIKHEGVVVAQT